jgi:hypothetical protein
MELFQSEHIMNKFMEILSEWLRMYVEEQTRMDLPQIHKNADYYKDDFETALEKISKAHEANICMMHPKTVMTTKQLEINWKINSKDILCGLQKVLQIDSPYEI